MKKNIYLVMVGLAGLLIASCAKEVGIVKYTPDVKIQFEAGGDSNIVSVDKGKAEYTLKIDVQSSGSVISLFEIYNANPTTGNRDTLITSLPFDHAKDDYSTTYTVKNLIENRCLKVVVTDTLGQEYEKNVILQITPAVLFSATQSMETVENYYGPYYATWLSGRVYMRRDSEYKQDIDFSLGDVVISSEGNTPVPALVNPVKRGDYHLLTMDGLQNTQFELTSLTGADYNNITQVNATPITSLPDPTLDAVKIESGKVYLFKTASGKKGLVHILSLSRKNGMIEIANNEWADSTYYEAAITTKTVVP